MPAYSAPADVAKAALARAGCLTIQTLSESSPAADLLNTVYEPIVLDALAEPGWADVKRIVKLVYQGAYDGDWLYAWSLPQPAGGVLSSEQIYLSTTTGTEGQDIARQPIDFERRGDQLLTNRDSSATLYLTYYTRGDESLWAPDFAQRVMLEVASVCARRLRFDAPLADRLYEEAMAKRNEARARIANAQTPEPAFANPIARAWTGRARRRPRFGY